MPHVVVVGSIVSAIK